MFVTDNLIGIEASSIPRALVSIILRFPRLKFAIVTLGKDGCIMLEKCVDGGKNTFPPLVLALSS